MKILFVHAAADWSISDVSRGYRSALVRQGHEIVKDYWFSNRLKFFNAGVTAADSAEAATLSIHSISLGASEGVVIEAMYKDPDLVLFSGGGLGFHPNALWLLQKAGYKSAIIHTESPYEDDNQAYLSNLIDHTFTNDRWSAKARGWGYLPPSYDPAIHRPTAPEPGEPACDVLILGTGWAERVKLLEQIDWTGIKLRILGMWPEITEGSPLFPFTEQRLIDNEDAPALYATAKICLNFHRHHPKAESLNPRAYELAACGCFQISDWRAELDEVFKGAVPIFDPARPQTLEALIRDYLADDDKRDALAARQCSLVQGETFDVRAARLMEVVEADLNSTSRPLLAVSK